MLKKIYFAGGCFWGVEAYLKKINGVIDTSVGYAQGQTKNPTYQEVCSQKTGHTETCEIVYDDQIVSLLTLLKHLFRVIDPTSINKQGSDIGPQYRTGIYYVDYNDLGVIEDFILKSQSNYEKEIVVEVEKLNDYFLAEDYHQDYLTKNPNGYCHINLNAFKDDI